MARFSFYKVIINLIVCSVAISTSISVPAKDQSSCDERQWHAIEAIAYREPIKVEDVLGNFVDPHGSNKTTATSRSLQIAKKAIGKKFTAASMRHRPLDSSLSFASWKASQETDRGIHADLDTLGRLLEARSQRPCLSRLSTIRKSLEQQTYWDIYNSTLPIYGAMESNKEPYFSRSIRRAVIALLRKIELTPEQIQELNAAGEETSILMRIAKEITGKTPYKLINISHTQSTTLHSIVTNGRSYFDSFVVANNAEHETKLGSWLRSVRFANDSLAMTETERASIGPVVDGMRHPPSDTLLLLVRYPFVIDSGNSVRPTKIVERVSSRFYRTSANGFAHEQYNLYELDVARALRSNAFHYLSLNMRSIGWAGLLSSVPEPLSFQGVAAITTLRNNCAACHNFASPGPGDIFSDGGASVSFERNVSDQADLTLTYLRSGQMPSYTKLTSELSVPEDDLP